MSGAQGPKGRRADHAGVRKPRAPGVEPAVAHGGPSYVRCGPCGMGGLPCGQELGVSEEQALLSECGATCGQLACAL